MKNLISARKRAISSIFLLLIILAGIRNKPQSNTLPGSRASNPCRTGEPCCQL